MQLVLQDAQIALAVSNSIFDRSFNEALVHQVVNAYTARSHQGTRAQKTRSEVTGSNKKPWRQKGTGRARSGSLKSPIWRSGGVAFAARPKNYYQKVNKKMYRNALKSIFSELVRQNRLIVVEQFSIEAPKTKLLAQKLKNMNLKNVLIITSEMDGNLFLAARNLPWVDVRCVTAIDPINLINFNKILITVCAVKQVEELLA